MNNLRSITEQLKAAVSLDQQRRYNDAFAKYTYCLELIGSTLTSLNTDQPTINDLSSEPPKLFQLAKDCLDRAMVLYNNPQFLNQYYQLQSTGNLLNPYPPQQQNNYFNNSPVQPQQRPLTQSFSPQPSFNNSNNLSLNLPPNNNNFASSNIPSISPRGVTSPGGTNIVVQQVAQKDIFEEKPLPVLTQREKIDPRSNPNLTSSVFSHPTDGFNGKRKDLTLLEKMELKIKDKFKSKPPPSKPAAVVKTHEREEALRQEIMALRKKNALISDRLAAATTKENVLTLSRLLSENKALIFVKEQELGYEIELRRQRNLKLGIQDDEGVQPTPDLNAVSTSYEYIERPMSMRSQPPNFGDELDNNNSKSSKNLKKIDPKDKWSQFIAKHFNYDSMDPKRIDLDNKWLFTVAQRPDDDNLIRSHLQSILNNNTPKHALKDVISAFADYFKEEYKTDGVSWRAIQPAIDDINEFREKLVMTVSSRWQKGLNYDTGVRVLRQAITDAILEKIHDPLMKLYNLQSINSDKEAKLQSIKDWNLDDLQVSEKLLLTNVPVPYQSAIRNLQDLQSISSANDRLKLVAQAANSIFDCVNNYWRDGSAANIDDTEILPVFLYCILKANVPNFPSIWSYIDTFADEETLQSCGRYGLNMLGNAMDWALQFPSEFDEYDEVVGGAKKGCSCQEHGDYDEISKKLKDCDEERSVLKQTLQRLQQENEKLRMSTNQTSLDDIILMQKQQPVQTKKDEVDLDERLKKLKEAELNNNNNNNKPIASSGRQPSSLDLLYPMREQIETEKEKEQAARIAEIDRQNQLRKQGNQVSPGFVQAQSQIASATQSQSRPQPQPPQKQQPPQTQPPQQSTGVNPIFEKNKPDLDVDWFYLDTSKVQQGPVRFQALYSLFKSQKIGEKTYVFGGPQMAKWTMIKDVPVLSDALRF